MKRTVVLIILMFSVLVFGGCGKAETVNSAPAVAVGNDTLPDVNAFMNEYNAAQAESSNNDAAVQNWVPTGNYTLKASALVMYVRITSVDTAKGTAEIAYMQTDNTEASVQPVNMTVNISRTDFGSGNLEYSFTIDGMEFIFSGTSTSRTNKVMINGQAYYLESQGKG